MDINHLLSDDLALSLEAGRLGSDPDTPFPILSTKIKITWRCNLRCGFCTLWRISRDRRPEDEALTPDCLREILSALTAQGLRKVHFSGGEVLLRDDFGEIVKQAHELGLQVNLTTNGTLLGKEEARYLVENRVHTVAFSLDAATEKKHDIMRGVEGAWHRTWKGIDRLKARREAKGRGPILAVNTVVTRRNLDDLPDLFNLLGAKGLESWRLLPIRTANRKMRPRASDWDRLTQTLNVWQPLLIRRPIDGRFSKNAQLAAKGQYAGRAIDDHPCFAPWFNLFIDADGEAYPCCTGRKSITSYGNVLRSSVAEVLAAPIRREIVTSFASGYVFEVCRTCEEFAQENEIFSRAAQVRSESYEI